MEKRRDARKRKRLPCELVIDGKSHSGIVHDVSSMGLFVQTRARPKPGTSVEVALRPHGTSEEIRFDACVARQRVVPTQLQASLPGGVGLVIEDPTEDLQAILASVVGGEPSGTADKRTLTRTYRVRVKQRNQPNARVITVRCESVQAARARALRQVGSGWTVADVQEL